MIRLRVYALLHIQTHDYTKICIIDLVFLLESMVWIVISYGLYIFISYMCYGYSHRKIIVLYGYMTLVLYI